MRPFSIITIPRFHFCKFDYNRIFFNYNRKVSPDVKWSNNTKVDKEHIVLLALRSKIQSELKFFNLPENFSNSDLKQKYLKYAKTLHPDINPDKEAAVLFNEVQGNYEKLKEFLKFKEQVLKMSDEDIQSGILTIDLDVKYEDWSDVRQPDKRKAIINMSSSIKRARGRVRRHKTASFLRSLTVCYLDFVRFIRYF